MKKILIVEDNTELSGLICDLLVSKGFEAISCEDGIKALEMVREELPDLVITDVMMPKMDGYGLCRMMKFDRNLGRIPVIILTARKSESDEEISRQVKADAYLPKPYDPQKLMEKVEELIKND